MLIIPFQGIANQNHNELSPYIHDNDSYQKDQKKYWQEYGEKGILMQLVRM